MTAENSKRSARLHRLEMIFVRSPVYFITACTHNRSEILGTPAVHQGFVEFGRHFHAFVAIDPERTTLAKWMKSLKNVLSKTLRSAGVPAPHWQKTFFDHLLRSSESYGQKWDYVRENPVRAGFVQKWDEWPFCGEIFALEYRSDR